MRVLCDKHELKKLRRRFLRSAPRERMEACWGKREGNEYHVYLFMPLESMKGTRTSVTYDAEELQSHKDEAYEEGLQFLGTIHSHIDCDGAPSEHDIDDAVIQGELVTGIFHIATVNGRRRCRVKFYSPMIGVEVEIT